MEKVFQKECGGARGVCVCGTEMPGIAGRYGTDCKGFPYASGSRISCGGSECIRPRQRGQSAWNGCPLSVQASWISGCQIPLKENSISAANSIQ